MRPFIPIADFQSRERLRRHLLALAAFILFLIVVVVVFAWVFQYMMLHHDGQERSFVDGLYWTITTMSTLGFGDITFVSHAGKLYSGFVTLAGVFLLGVILPFSIIAIAFGPWLERLLRYRPPAKVARKLSGHVIISGWDSVSETLTKKLKAAGIPYVTVIPDIDTARHLEEEGISVIYGRSSNAETYKRARVDAARMVVANASDPDNANIVLTVASTADTPVTAVVTDPERAHLMSIAGAHRIVPLREILGNYLAVRATTKGAMGHVVDSLGDLLFAEISAHGTPFVGQALRETGIREKTGVSIIGIWERGHFSLPSPDTIIGEGMVMLLVGTRSDLETLEDLISTKTPDDLVIIAGYGTVGAAAAAALERKHVRHVVIDTDPTPGTEAKDFILGDAGKEDVLREAGIMEAGGLIVTTNDDGINVFLTLAARHIGPHIRIVARANREENVAELYEAGADFVVSHSSVGASILDNMIEERQTVFLTEGVHIFWRQVPDDLAGKTLAESHLRSLTGATVVAIQKSPKDVYLSLGPDTLLGAGSTIILVGTPESEGLFTQRFGRRSRRHGGAGPAGAPH